ncbi:hypothetical protein DAPPUDRAFT_316460 [Daphnia pulex]|uniref:C2H2-type domain-containing protein n=1 Tax=Daphnia pulex TaxID=6669 RepID=E9GD00_DAPPU|nr:hypothetical protein DAPPUDRAFT_316460 [Daphnia pulex]|eukprot:EFX82644.1 hypothetical protein DAPPUDRAFT_316460 [Daphnia pulex]
MLCPIEFYEIQDPLQCNIIDVYDESIEKENMLSNAILTREEFLHQLAQLREENKIERLLELEETWSAILRVNDHVKANYAQGLVNEMKIGNLEDKVGGVYHKVEELNGKVDNLSKKCQSLKQRMVEEIPKITEKETMEKTKPTHQLSPCVSNGSSIITLEMADLCANAVINYDVNFKDNTTKKLNSDSQKISSNQNNQTFCCEICGKEYRLRNSLNSHRRKKHSLTSRGRPIGENRPQVEKGFWCTHCNKGVKNMNQFVLKSPSPVQPLPRQWMDSSRTVQKRGKTSPIDFLADPIAIT